MAKRQVKLGFWQAIDCDILTHARYASDFFGNRIGTLRKIGILLTPGMLCTLLYRISHGLWGHGLRRFAGLASWLNFVVHKATIHPASRIGPGLYIPHTVGVIFFGHAGGRLTLYANAIVAPCDMHGSRAVLNECCPLLGDGVTVGAFAMALGAITVGNDVKIGPGSVCSESLGNGVNLISGDHAKARPSAVVHQLHAEQVA